MMYNISPTLLCCHPFKLEESLRELNELGVDWFHIDLMDGHFVPNLAISIDQLECIIPYGKYPFFVHMMVTDPSQYIQRMADMGVKYFVFHYEAVQDHFRLCKMIADKGMIPGIALNPGTPPTVLRYLLDYVGVVTLMGIEPGFSGQKFMPFTYEKIRELKNMIGTRNVLIEVDGGADNEIAAECLRSGADVVVGGCLDLFKPGEKLRQRYAQLRDASVSAYQIIR